MGVTTAKSGARKQKLMFQSTSMPKDGCNAAGADTVLMLTKFQSTSIPKDGCNPTSSLTVVGSIGVSIHIHPERWM